MESLSQNTAISTDPETKGFDLAAGNTWIYPENYPVREYQYNIVRTALYYNTLVCLPTGLGKTFIAAVVMYNFWRWYPFGKIVFLAPTKPLVAQQINACYEVMGIPSADMMELTGAVNQKNREVAWLRKRIIFATPQVFHNDLEKSIVPSHLVKCVVVDEAHKALGKHSYCECVRILSTMSQYFRILALSATPGNKMDNVHEVIHNLHISHLELRDENSIDIMPYVNRRKVDIILVPLNDELAAFKERYIVIMDRHVRSLIQCNVLRGQTANISKGRIFHLLREFKTKTERSGNYAQIMKTLNILLTMYHAYELMIRHGLRAFNKFYQNHSDKFWMHNESHLRDLLHDIEIYLGPFPNIYPNGDVSEISANLVFGHNKFHKLKELLEHHFRSKSGDEKDTRAIVFVEYRDIVSEVYILLLQSRPIIRPQMFVGQASQKQKQQIKALEDFRSNRVNVLISTSIGEEGLDVGEVDLIICFDVSQHSPIRLVQRMGRTGRKRDGHIIVLVTDGKEHENLKSTLSKRDSLNNKILNTSNIFSSLYQTNPRMIPNQYNPECHKIHIIALPKTPNVKGTRKRKGIKKKNEAVPSAKQKKVSSIATQKCASQSTMMKFLTNNKCNDQKQIVNTRNILGTLITQSNNVSNTINPGNVKLLSDDNAGIDFLTLCAVKKSEEEMSSEIVRKMDTTYIPAPKPVPNFFNFVVPDVKVLDNLSFLSTNLNKNMPTQRKSCEDNDDVCNDYINIDDDNFWCTIRNENNVEDNDKVRFEDILDESSDSQKTSISHLNRGIIDIEIDSVNTSNVPASSAKVDDEITTDCPIMDLSADMFDMEPSTFENILNNSFSSIEDNLKEDDDTTPRSTMPSDTSNIVNKNVEKIDVSCESLFDASHSRDNVDRSNQSLSVSAKFAKSQNQTNKFVRSFIDEIQDFDFNTDDDISEFARESNETKSIRTSKAEESLLSVTQAIDEIARMKCHQEKPRPSVSKEESTEESSGWISVNTKRETKIEKKDTSSGMGNKLPDISRNHSTAKSRVKEDFDFLVDDSDEDFMITEDNAKRFDELESSYFRKYSDTSKNTGNESNSLRNASKNSTNGSDYFCSTSKSVEPRGTSTPTHDRRVGLSLRRNKSQLSTAIDLNVFKVPSKYANSRRNESALESDVNSPSGRISPPSDRKNARKIRREYKCREKNDFIDDEAMVSSGGSSDETVDMTDEDLADFVSYTQNIDDQVDMQAHYLQTIKSPIKRPGAFHFKRPRSPDPDVEIYSQPQLQVQDSYLYDSFCVSEDVEQSMLTRGDSILEMAERELERKRRKKRLHSNKNNASKRKKTNILNNSMSSEDEIEQLRIQVQED